MSKIVLESDTGAKFSINPEPGISANKDIIPAHINGDASQQFKVADAVNGDEALSKGQLLNEIKKVDGIGSGLDADLLRGLPADFTASLSGNGYQKLPSGLIIQWGILSAPPGQTQVTFPIAFPTYCSVVTGSPDANHAAAEGNDKWMNITTSSFVLENWVGVTANYRWVAIGY